MLALALESDNSSREDFSYGAYSSGNTSKSFEKNASEPLSLSPPSNVETPDLKMSPLSSNDFDEVGFQMDDHLKQEKENMMLYLQEKMNMNMSTSQEISKILVYSGVLNVVILKRRLARNRELLLDLGMDDQISDAFLEHFGIRASHVANQSQYSLNDQNRQYNPKLSKSSDSFFSEATSIVSSNDLYAAKRSPMGASFFNSNNSMNAFDRNHASEICTLYYQASQLKSLSASETLQNYAHQNSSQLSEGFLMRMYALGQGHIEKDVEKAREIGQRLLPWLREAYSRSIDTDTVVPHITYLLGVCFSEGLGTFEDKRESIRWFKTSADKYDHFLAQAYLGFAYYHGIGVSKSHSEAVKYYSKAAGQHHAGAQSNLGLCYEHGLGVPKDVRRAVKYYDFAAQQGDIGAIYNVGFCYEKGIGVEMSYKKAVDYYQRSAEEGHTNAQHQLALCLYYGNGLEQNLEEACHLFALAAEKGHAPSQRQLGMCYEQGHGINQDLDTAFYWYKQSADQNDVEGLFYAGFCYFSGTGVEQNIEEAVKYYKKSAAKNHPPALNNLGTIYLQGTVVQKDLALAASYFTKSANLGYPSAQYNLGYCYEHGYGVQKNLNLVLRYYKLAASNGNEKASNALLKFQ